MFAEPDTLAILNIAANPDGSLSGRGFAALFDNCTDNFPRAVTPLCALVDGSPSDRCRWVFNALSLGWNTMEQVKRSAIVLCPKTKIQENS